MHRDDLSYKIKTFIQIRSVININQSPIELIFIDTLKLFVNRHIFCFYILNVSTNHILQYELKK